MSRTPYMASLQVVRPTSGGKQLRDLRTRKNIRLNGYDYSRTGRYFITICVKAGHEMFGTIVDGNMQLSEYGRSAEHNLVELAAHIKGIRIDKYVIMPNHVHMILIVDSDVGTRYIASAENDSALKSKQTVSRAIQQYKASVTRDSKIGGLWQPRFHDHIIRDESEYRKIWHYIDKNPPHWQEDYYYMENRTKV